MKVDSLLDRLSGALFAPRCLLCGLPGQRPCLDLCPACESGLQPLPQPACRHCALPLGPARTSLVCETCERASPPFERCIASFRYSFPVDAMVQDLKYRGRLPLARVLGELLARSVQAQHLRGGLDGLLPVPLHPLRHADRGFNQSAEIARWCARRLGLPLELSAARRIRPTAPQALLSRTDRRGNLRQAFSVDPRVKGRRLAIVDDVVTSGSTVRELSSVLLAAGAAVVVCCVARTID
ncbi:MAG TPA: ComF family protein [Steroidobacteraceae bacterium]|nr:ComF family protein [Steroidobacteraceae bacterium]